MACTDKSADSNVTFEFKGSTSDNHSEYGQYLRRSDVPAFQQEVAEIQKNNPGLFKQDIPKINATLEQQKLLPGFEVVALRDEHGVDRDANGVPMMRTAKEIEAIATGMTDQLTEKQSGYTKAFDKYHQGFDDNNPLHVIWPAQLTQDNISAALKDLTMLPSEKKMLENLSKDFDYISNREGGSNAISRDEIGIWHDWTQWRVDNKIGAFVTGDPVTKLDKRLQDENGDISIFDWENKRACAVDYDGNAYIQRMTW